MKCPLCGFEFDEEGKGACAGCPMALGSCNLIKCLNCGYCFPGEAKLLKLLKKWRRVVSR